MPLFYHETMPQPRHHPQLIERVGPRRINQPPHPDQIIVLD
jgi:hypothetical protein